MREIVEYPDPVLTKPCREITAKEIQDGMVDAISLQELVNDMIALMRGGAGSRGVGLAAPQVGIGVNLCLVEMMGAKAAPLVLINPILTEPRGKTEGLEGCLSLPGINISVKRPQMVKVNALSISGERIEFDANGMLSRVIQHEVDHLSGVLILTKGNLIGRPKVHAQLKVLEERYERLKRWKERGSDDKNNAGSTR